MPRALTVGIDCRYIQDKFHGIGRYTYQLVQHLAQLPDVARVCAFVDPQLSNRRFPLEALARDGRIELRPFSIPLYHPSELRLWRAAVRTAMVDVFHAPYVWAPLVLDRPLITTVHDMIFDRYPSYMPQRHLALGYRIMSRLAMRRSRRIIAISEATRNDILAFSRTDPRKIDVVYNGIESHFRPVLDEHVRQIVRQRYGLPARYVLALGAQRPHKNIDRLVAAFRAIAEDVPQSLVLVGERDPRFAEKHDSDWGRLATTGRLHTLDFVAEQDLPALYSMADLFVQPSIIEGFGLPVGEAMACGCPIACSNTSCLPEVAGNVAAYFDPMNTSAIAATLRGALKQQPSKSYPQEQSIVQARRFDWLHAAAQTLDVYRHALSV